jgi:signal-transduction protein with cAMP-binding, CBS, and nucleotidyltransferase domain
MASIESIRGVQDAHDMMADLGIRHLVVREAGKVVGVLSARDLLVYFKSVSEPNIAQD